MSSLAVWPGAVTFRSWTVRAVPLAWTFRSLDLSFMDRSGRAAGLDLSFPGPFVPWTFRSWTVRAVPLAWTFRSLDLSFPGPFVHGPFGPCRWPLSLITGS